MADGVDVVGTPEGGYMPPLPNEAIELPPTGTFEGKLSIEGGTEMHHFSDNFKIFFFPNIFQIVRDK